MLLLGIIFSLLFQNSFASQDGKEVCTLLSMCNNIEAIKSELVGVREEQRRHADILERLDKKFDLLLGNSYPANCAESSKHNLLIRVPAYSAYPFEVTCDQESHGGGWTVFLRRNDGSQEFFLEWKDYKEGFGLLENEFFMGLDILHAMTASEPQELLVLLEDYGGIQAYALYDNFRVGPECNNYTLESVGSFSGDAGDSLTTHEGMQFSTKDRDNDVWDGNCALKYTGAWWYRDCHWSNLCGTYGKDKPAVGVIWETFASYSNVMKRAVMMMRPKTYSLKQK
ncbi:ryncolin-1-like [Drosophila elegans]|uniref:ryncolin-1-like n=1 Tax=Drosophila elegans TaxID=30023 RepID=UPI0007E874DA|nr:ryncolin-1-like [Drosophila elegans]